MCYSFLLLVRHHTKISFIFINQSDHFWFMADYKVIFNWFALSNQIVLIIKTPNYHLSLAKFRSKYEIWVRQIKI